MTPSRLARLLLDAQISGRYVAEPLRSRGHDVLLVDEDRRLDGAADTEILELAAAENRILVTFDVKDFMPLAREWAERGKRHSGLIVVVGLRSNEFGELISGVQALVTEGASSQEWTDRVVLLGRRADT